MTRIAASLIVLCVFLAPVGAAEQPAEDAPSPLDDWVAYYQEVADGYDVRLKSDPEHPLPVSAEPVHVYTNPASGFDTHGAFFVWTHDGRAEAIGAIWSRLTGSNSARRFVHHEFQSLSTEPFVAGGKDGLVWAPTVAGLELKMVEDAPLPANTDVLRLAQMRTLARRFAGYHVHPTEFQLRFLPRPLYRYALSDDRDEAADGAVFAFFMDWDPEILLVLETRPTDDGPRWHYAAGRFSNKPLRLEYAGTEVWRHKGGDFGDRHGPFYARHGVAIRPAVIADGR